MLPAMPYSFAVSAHTDWRGFLNMSIKKAFETLRDDWGANVVRLAMYTEEYGGYCNGGDKEA
mgnify:CR=1 FL=1